jgi:FlaA1/EpsC-like NDP-sugar epimerase
MSPILVTRIKRAILVFMDMASVALGLTLAFLLRFDFALDPVNRVLLYSTIPLALIGYILPFWHFRLYTGIWRYSSFPDLVRIIQATTTGFVCTSCLILMTHHGNYPRSVILISPILLFLGICTVRFLIRFRRDYIKSAPLNAGTRLALIIGANDIGESLLRHMELAPNALYRIVAFLDDAPVQWDKHIHGVPILGGLDRLPELLKKREIDDVIIAVHARRGDVVRAAADALLASGSKAELRIVPALSELLNNANGSQLKLRKVRPADLLNREEAKLDEPLIARFLAGKTLLVTGAGGTIGQELCRQSLRYGPSKVILLDSHATSLFYAERTMRESSPKMPIIPVLGSTQDTAFLERVFAEHKPQIVMHAAAHKHVPQLEHNVQEAVLNNLLSTHNCAEAAHRHGAQAFLLVSTDKAVSPSSVMGATKRAAELAVMSFARRSETRFMAVRFGNVLGSSGSVLRIFQEQLERGGPLTLTHPDMTRYFMTVEEAVQLILQACAMAAGGEIFMLKMGEPVRILDMARNLILLNGLKPDVDVQIQYTGVRPGEKMAEDLAENAGDVKPSSHPQILLAHPSAPPKNMDKLVRDFEELCQEGGEAEVLERLKEIVPTFVRPAPKHRDGVRS